MKYQYNILLWFINYNTRLYYNNICIIFIIYKLNRPQSIIIVRCYKYNVDSWLFMSIYVFPIILLVCSIIKSKLNK